MKMRALLLSLVIAAGMGVSRAASADPAPATQPAPVAVSANVVGELQLRANEDMARGDFATALPLLQKVSELITDQPDQLGPVLEQIRTCRHQIANGVGKPPVGKTPDGKPLVATLSVVPLSDSGPRKPHPAVPAGQTLDLKIKELGNFDYDATTGGGIPDDVKRLDGCHFRTSGYMVPIDQAESISEFALVPSLFACCFGQPPQIQHTIVVQTPKGKALSYFPDELIVEGTLHVKEVRDGDFIVSIFQMDASSVKAAPQ